MMYLYKSGRGWIEDTVSYYNGALRDRSNDETQKDILVYGRSQVGKTTFILKLIGIRPEKYSELEHVLRGGDQEGKREKGKSSTSVATLYTNSGNDFFSLEERNIKSGFSSKQDNLSPKDMSKKLIDIRTGLRKWETDKIIKIGIPSNYFNNNIKTNAQIIDFPGVASDSNEEYRYVQDALSFYQLRVSAVIIFELKSKIKFLNRPLQAGLRYDLNPSKYILITTMSFSSDMTIRHYKEDGWSMEDIINKSRDDVMKELKKIKRYNFEILPEYYPVEIGESLEKIILDEPEYGRALKKQMEETFSNVRRIIEAKNSNTLFNSIEEIRSGKIKGHEDRIKQLTLLKEKILKKNRNLSRKSRRKEKSKEYFCRQLAGMDMDQVKYEQIIKEITDKKEEVAEKIRNDNLLSVYSLRVKKDRREYMYECFVKDYSLIRESVSELLVNLIDATELGGFEEKISSEFASANESIKAKKAKGFEIKKNREEFLCMLLEKMNQLLDFVETGIMMLLNECELHYISKVENLQKHRKIIDTRIRMTNGSINKTKEQITQNNKEVTDIDNKIFQAQICIKDQKNILREILQNANQFCNEHKNQYKHCIFDPTSSPDKRFMALLVYKKICFDQERMNRYYGENK